jgi:hypothetical protein
MLARLGGTNARFNQEIGFSHPLFPLPHVNQQRL